MDQIDKYPLHTAARQGQVAVAENLLKNNPSLSKKQDEDGRYPIHWATSSNSFEIITLLADLPSFDPDIQDHSGWTPLMISSSLPSTDAHPAINLLLSKGASPEIPTTTGQTALHFASSKQNLDTARLLLSTSRAPARIRDRRGQLPIHRAAAVGSTPMVALLLKSLSPLDPVDVEGFTPLHHAIAEGHGDTAVALLKEGADFSIKTGDRMTPLELAPDQEVRKYIIQAAEREGIELA